MYCRRRKQLGVPAVLYILAPQFPHCVTATPLTVTEASRGQRTPATPATGCPQLCEPDPLAGRGGERPEGPRSTEAAEAPRRSSPSRRHPPRGGQGAAGRSRSPPAPLTACSPSSSPSQPRSTAAAILGPARSCQRRRGPAGGPQSVRVPGALPDGGKGEGAPFTPLAQRGGAAQPGLCVVPDSSLCSEPRCPRGARGDLPLLSPALCGQPYSRVLSPSGTLQPTGAQAPSSGD